MPKVCCFLPVFNAAHYLDGWWERNGPELSSVDATLLVVDNASEDETLEKIREFKYPDTVVISHNENKGLLSSFDTAESHFDCDYRLFLPSDDWLAPYYLKTAVDIMQDMPSVGVVYGKSYMVDSQTRKIALRNHPVRDVGRRKESIYFPRIFGNAIPDLSLYRNSAVVTKDRRSSYDPSFISRVLADWDVFYTGENQCYSLKSSGQESKVWQSNGYYYQYITEAYAKLLELDASQTGMLIKFFLDCNFHTGLTLVKIKEAVNSGHIYVQVALKRNHQIINKILCSMLFDQLLISVEPLQFYKKGGLGTIDELKFLLSTLSLSDRSEILGRYSLRDSL